MARAAFAQFRGSSIRGAVWAMGIKQYCIESPVFSLGILICWKLDEKNSFIIVKGGSKAQASSEDWQTSRDDLPVVLNDSFRVSATASRDRENQGEVIWKG
ncbi:hypothetical protein Mapa_002229 [Marchantia paleacea]|nr:hypothetical protein Mapa_002229 [Marchantia paleacea]